MKKSLKIQIFMVLLAAVLVAGSATAGMMDIPADPKVEVESELGSAFGTLGVVDSYVYQFTSGQYANQYLYTYKLTSSNIGITFFSVGVNEALNLTLNVADVNYEADGGVNPSYWGPSGTPVQSVDAGFFVTPIYSGQSSALLWFISEYEPILGTGSIFGTASGIPAFASGQLYTIPEPTTIALLGLASIALFKRNRK